MDLAERMESLRVEAVAAVEAGDFQTALDKLIAIRMIVETSPDSEHEGLRMEWRNLEPFYFEIQKLARERSGTGGKIQSKPITYRRPDCDIDFTCR